MKAGAVGLTFFWSARAVEENEVKWVMKGGAVVVDKTKGQVR
jgi:hypothetical protein